MRRESVDLIWIDDPEASHYDVPCKGCVGFCDLEDTDDATGDDYGKAQCEGRTMIRRTTIWRAIIEFTWLNEHGGESRLMMSGLGQSEDAAIENAETLYAVGRLRNDPFDPMPVQ